MTGYGKAIYYEWLYLKKSSVEYFLLVDVKRMDTLSENRHSMEGHSKDWEICILLTRGVNSFAN